TITMDIAGDKITNLIKNQLNLTWAEAEQAKQICGLNHQAGEGIIRETIKAVVDELTAAIGKNIAYYAEHFPQASPITAIILCGGGTRLPNLKETLAAKLGNMNIYHGNSLINLVKNLKNIRHRQPSPGQLDFLHPDLRFEKVKSQEPLPAEAAITFTTAIGLGLSNVFN
ncbi:MAG: pilus assembly protein PilM, partial [Patescibacteria group bacterium]